MLVWITVNTNLSKSTIILLTSVGQLRAWSEIGGTKYFNIRGEAGLRDLQELHCVRHENRELVGYLIQINEDGNARFTKKKKAPSQNEQEDKLDLGEGKYLECRDRKVE